MNRFPAPWIEFLVYFHADRDFFECHEVLEEYWKETAGSEHSRIWHGLIQIAVSLYHERRGNMRGAHKMLAFSVVNLRGQPLHEVGLDGARLQALLEQRLSRLETGAADLYKDLDLPIASEELMGHCIRRCKERGVVWGAPSRLDDHFLLNKHTLRDRTDVIRERESERARRRGETT